MTARSMHAKAMASSAPKLCEVKSRRHHPLHRDAECDPRRLIYDKDVSGWSHGRDRRFFLMRRRRRQFCRGAGFFFKADK